MSPQPAQRVGGLEIEQDVAFQRLDWRVERVGWVVFTLVLVAGLAGLLGPGPLSHTTAGDPAALAVEYQRFGRYQAPEEIRVRVGPGAARDGRVRLWLDGPFVEAHDVEHVTPPPEVVEARAGGYDYVFRAADGAPLSVTFNVQPQRAGRHRGAVAVGGGPRVEFAQFVYP